MSGSEAAARERKAKAIAQGWHEAGLSATDLAGFVATARLGRPAQVYGEFGTAVIDARTVLERALLLASQVVGRATPWTAASVETWGQAVSELDYIESLRRRDPAGPARRGDRAVTARRDPTGVCPVCRRYRPLTRPKGLIAPHPVELGRPAMCSGAGQMPVRTRP